MYDLITVGSATLDVFADTEGDVIEIKTKDSDTELVAYPLGSKILIKTLNFEIGGGGTNTAVASSKLGLKVGYMGSVGNDENGENIINLLKKENIDFLGTKVKEMTNYSIILDSLADDRTILVYKGASEKFDFTKIKKKPKSKWIYLCAMVNDGFKQLEKIAKYANENSIKIAFNPSCYLAEQGCEYLKNVLKYTDLLILNKEEAEILVGKHDNQTLVKMLFAQGPKNVVITDGHNPLIVLYNHKISKFKPKKIKTRETTGAGDAFGATLVSSLIIKKDIKFAVNCALKNCESVIKNVGAKNGLLRRKELLKLIKT